MRFCQHSPSLSAHKWKLLQDDLQAENQICCPCVVSYGISTSLVAVSNTRHLSIMCPLVTGNSSPECDKEDEWGKKKQAEGRYCVCSCIDSFSF